MNKTLLALGGIFVATMAIVSAQTTGTLTGTIVDVATYVTKDHNMDSMMKSGHAMSGDRSMSGSTSGEHMMAGGSHAVPASDHAMADSMSGDRTHNGTKEACHMLGLLASGHITLLASQTGSSAAAELCGRLNKTVTVTGKSYTQAGATIFLVDRLQ